jgi:hypothetical protein
MTIIGFSCLNEYLSAWEKKIFPSIPQASFLDPGIALPIYRVTTHHMSISNQRSIQSMRYPSFNGIYFISNMASRSKLHVCLLTFSRSLLVRSLQLGSGPSITRWRGSQF